MTRYRAALTQGISTSNIIYGKIRDTYQEAKKDLEALQKKHPGHSGIVLRTGDPLWSDTE